MKPNIEKELHRLEVAAGKKLLGGPRGEIVLGIKYMYRHHQLQSGDFTFSRTFKGP
jgi:hypothetical protein